MKIDERSLMLYAVTNRRNTERTVFYRQIEDALKGGVTMLQLREKDMSDEEYIAEAAEVRKICDRYDVPLIINDRLEVALRSGADGIHIGQDDISAAEVRNAAGPGFMIGVTAKTVEQAVKAEADGADYLGSGAVFPSPSKKEAVRITKDELKNICDAVNIPVIAIGGVNCSNIQELEGCGISGIAAVSAIFDAEDIMDETIRLKQEVLEIVYGRKL